jgi:hypothetical protein
LVYYSSFVLTLTLWHKIKQTSKTKQNKKIIIKLKNKKYIINQSQNKIARKKFFFKKKKKEYQENNNK